MEIDVRYVEQLAEEGQLSLCGWILRQLKFSMNESDLSFVECLQKIFLEIKTKEFDCLVPYNDGLQTIPRLQDVMGVINRIRF
jgi:hypothetical protein